MIDLLSIQKGPSFMEIVCEIIRYIINGDRILHLMHIVWVTNRLPTIDTFSVSCINGHVTYPCVQTCQLLARSDLHIIEKTTTCCPTVISTIWCSQGNDGQALSVKPVFSNLDLLNLHDIYLNAEQRKVMQQIVNIMYLEVSCELEQVNSTFVALSLNDFGCLTLSPSIRSIMPS